jgi:hypothetical protein
MLGANGACSLFGHLAPEPYDLAPILGGVLPATTEVWSIAADHAHQLTWCDIQNLCMDIGEGQNSDA